MPGYGGGGRQLAKKYHPDKNKGDKKAEQRFTEIGRAYEVLSDDGKRQMYDRHGEAGLKNMDQGGGDPGAGAHDIFSAFFGGGGFGFGGHQHQKQQQKPKAPDLRVKLEVSLEELYNGVTVEVDRDVAVLREAPGTRQCKCKMRMVTKQLGPGMFQQYQQQVCDQCPNLKWMINRERIQVTVEPGAVEGEEIRMFEEGEHMIDGDPGDLVFRVAMRENNDPWRREGNDLHVTEVLSLEEALLGFKRELTHLDGRKVAHSAVGVTQYGTVKRLPKQGMPIQDRANHGDLSIHYTVAFPNTLTNKQKDLLQKALKR